MSRKRFSKKVKKAKAKNTRYSKKNKNIDHYARLQCQLDSIKRALSEKQTNQKLRNRREYSQDDLEQAINDVRENKLTYLAASEKYGVPESTIHNGVSGFVKTNQLGRATIISKEGQRAFTANGSKSSD